MTVLEQKAQFEKERDELFYDALRMLRDVQECRYVLMDALKRTNMDDAARIAWYESFDNMRELVKRMEYVREQLGQARDPESESTKPT